ncbi:MAG: hypothetical protein R3D66_04790 [Alphaproteobacteria bacterium]
MIAPQVWAGWILLRRLFAPLRPAVFIRGGGGVALHGLHRLCRFLRAHGRPCACIDTSRDLILGFKHADKTFAVKAFTPCGSAVPE